MEKVRCYSPRMPRTPTTRPILRTGNAIGRPPRYAGPAKQLTTWAPWVEWQQADSTMQADDVRAAIAFTADHAVSLSEYLRSALILLNRLLESPARAMILNFLREADRAYVEATDPEAAYERTAKIALHLFFAYAEPGTPEHARLHRQLTGAEDLPDGVAPTDDSAPWQNL